MENVARQRSPRQEPINVCYKEKPILNRSDRDNVFIILNKIDLYKDNELKITSGIVHL